MNERKSEGGQPPTMTTTEAGAQGQVALVTTTTGTAHFEMKVPGKVEYSNQVAGVYIPFEAPVADREATEANARTALETAKQLVFEALGVEYEVSYDDNGVERAVALLEDTFGPDVVVMREDRKGGGESSRGEGSDLGPLTIRKALNNNHPDWLLSQWQAGVKAGKIAEDDTELWDNRKFLQRFGGKGKNSGPWYKTVKGEVPIWPPRNHPDAAS